MDKYINLSKYLLDPTLWRFYKGGHTHYTCHDFYGSVSCGDSTCGNCSGARCCDDKEGIYPLICKEPDKLVLIRDQVYGDSFNNIDIDIINMGELVDSLRKNHEDFFEYENFYISNIDFPISEYTKSALGEKATNFFNALYELYKSL